MIIHHSSWWWWWWTSPQLNHKTVVLVQNPDDDSMIHSLETDVQSGSSHVNPVSPRSAFHKTRENGVSNTSEALWDGGMLRGGWWKAQNVTSWNMVVQVSGMYMSPSKALHNNPTFKKSSKGNLFGFGDVNKGQGRKITFTLQGPLSDILAQTPRPFQVAVRLFNPGVDRWHQTTSMKCMFLRNTWNTRVRNNSFSAYRLLAYSVTLKPEELDYKSRAS